MHEITENVVLEMTNVLSFRGKVTQQQLNEISKEIETLIKSNNAHKKGGSVSATYAVDTTGTIPLIDMELKIRHEGSPVYLQNTANELMRYISEHGYTPATAGYNVTVKEPANQADINNMIVDIYIGVNDNIL